MLIIFLTPMQLVMVVIIIFFAWCIISWRRDHKRLKIFMEFYDEVLKYIRDEADRFNVQDAVYASDMIEIVAKKSFCKKTRRLLAELNQLWNAKFAHLNK